MKLKKIILNFKFHFEENKAKENYIYVDYKY